MADAEIKASTPMDAPKLDKLSFDVMNAHMRAEYLAKEHSYQPCAATILTHDTLSTQMRRVLVGWLMEVGEEWCISRNTLHTTVNYVDRFVDWASKLDSTTTERKSASMPKYRFAIDKSNYQLVGLACLWIACKQYEMYPPNLDDLVLVSDGSYTRQQCETMELVVLNALHWNLLPCTSIEWLTVYFKSLIDIVDEKKAKIDWYQTIVKLYKSLDLALIDAWFLQFYPSAIAASALTLEFVYRRRLIMPDVVYKLTGYSYEDLLPIIIVMMYHSTFFQDEGRCATKTAANLKRLFNINESNLYTIQTDHPDTQHIMEQMTPDMYKVPDKPEVLCGLVAKAQQTSPTTKTTTTITVKDQDASSTTTTTMNEPPSIATTAETPTTIASLLTPTDTVVPTTSKATTPKATATLPTSTDAIVPKPTETNMSSCTAIEITCPLPKEFTPSLCLFTATVSIATTSTTTSMLRQQPDDAGECDHEMGNVAASPFRDTVVMDCFNSPCALEWTTQTIACVRATHPSFTKGDRCDMLLSSPYCMDTSV